MRVKYLESCENKNKCTEYMENLNRWSDTYI